MGIDREIVQGMSDVGLQLRPELHEAFEQLWVLIPGGIAGSEG